MGLLDQILGGGVANLFKTVMDTIRLSPEQKQAAQMALLQHQEDLAKMDADLEAKLADIQGQNIRSETTSNDPYVRRAHATFLYIMEIAIGVNLIVFPLVNLVITKKLSLLAIPSDYLQLFGAAFLGYTGFLHWGAVQVSKNKNQSSGD